MKFAAIALTVCMAAGAAAACASEQPEGDYTNEYTLAYVPLDDRPVNVDRVRYLCESLDYTLIMPDADLYKTHLDNQKTNSNGTQYGDREKLALWLENTEADCYVLSLDQMLSGGLVQSRVMTEESTDDAFELIDRMLDMIGDKPAVLFDSVMRLASTVGYHGYEMSEYNLLRAYGAVARRQLSGNQLTVEGIYNGYRTDADGKTVETELSEEVIDGYLNARRRKLELSEYYLLRTKARSNIYTYFGVDDSSPKVTIQTNEINYLKSLLSNGVVFSGLDELGLMGVTKLYLNLFEQKPTADVTYFGGGKDEPADDYDTGTLEQTVNGHLDSLGVARESSAPLKVLVLTKPSPNTSAVYNKAVEDMIAEIKSLTQKKEPVIVIDASTPAYYGKLQTGLVSGVELGMILSYSNWNTGANTVGIALANGLARYAYLKCAAVSAEGHAGHLKSLAYSYVKDITYKVAMMEQVERYVRDNVGSTSNFYGTMTDENAVNQRLKGFMETNGICSAVKILKNLNKSEYLVSVNNSRSASHGAIKTGGYRFPWYRTFEITFDVTL